MGEMQKTGAGNTTPRETMEAAMTAYEETYQKLSRMCREAETEQEKASRKAMGLLRQIRTEIRKGGPKEERAALEAKKKMAKEEAKRAEKQKEVLRLAAETAKESMMNAAANIIILEFRKDPARWTKSCARHKAFRALFAETFGDAVSVYDNTFGSTGISRVLQDGPTVWKDMPLGKEHLTEETIAQMELFHAYAPDDILPAVKAACRDRDACLNRYRKVREEFEETAWKYEGVLRRIFPHVPLI